MVVTRNVCMYTDLKPQAICLGIYFCLFSNCHNYLTMYSLINIYQRDPNVITPSFPQLKIFPDSPCSLLQLARTTYPVCSRD